MGLRWVQSIRFNSFKLVILVISAHQFTTITLDFSNRIMEFPIAGTEVFEGRECHVAKQSAKAAVDWPGYQTRNTMTIKSINIFEDP